MKRFEMGERVAVYANGGREVCKIVNLEDGNIWVVGIAGLNSRYLVHPKQVHRLVKRKRRVWELEAARFRDANETRLAFLVCYGPEVSPGDKIMVTEFRPKAKK